MHFKIRHGFLLVPAMCLVLAAPIHTHASDYRATAKVVCSTKTSVHIRKGPGLQYPVQTTIRRGEHVKKIGVSGSWTAVKSGGSVSYIKSCYLKKLYKLIYVAGDGVNLRSGVNIGETTDGQIARLSAYQKPLSALQAGDILMQIEPGANHAALYIGNGQYIHASSSRGRVVVSTYYPTSSYWTCCYDAAAFYSSQQ